MAYDISIATSGGATTATVQSLVIEGTTSGSTTFTAGSTPTPTTYTWPAAPINGNFLSTNGSGILSWSAVTTPSLTQVLTVGNSSGTNDIVIVSGQQITWNSDASISRNTSGVLQIGTTSANSSGTLLLTTLRTGDGSAGTPSHSFINATSTGMYITAGPTLSWAVGGSEMMTLAGFTLDIKTGGVLGWSSRGNLQTQTNARLEWNASGGGGTPMFLLGGSSSSFPAIKQSGSTLAVRLADDSDDAKLTALNVPCWTKYTFTFSDFSTAATTNSITLFSLRAGGVIHAVKIKHSTAFSGGAIASYTVEAGIAGNTTKYAPAFDVFQATGATTYAITNDGFGESHTASTTIQITATSTGANLDAATAGSVDVWVLASAAV